MSRWGKGWEVGVQKALSAQKRVRAKARAILAEEHGTRHVPGSRTDLCPKCQTEKQGGM